MDSNIFTKQYFRNNPMDILGLFYPRMPKDFAEKIPVDNEKAISFEEIETEIPPMFTAYPYMVRLSFAEIERLIKRNNESTINVEEDDNL